MRVNAYILAADPAWIEASVLSYYNLVNRIVVSYDENGQSWTGVPIDVDQCLRRLRAIDKDKKFEYRPGHFSRSEHFGEPMDNDTYQRQVAHDQASRDADWVLQLDTDEVISDIDVFSSCLADADGCRKNAFNYPAIWLYCRITRRWYLENCARGWRRHADYPGPVAVRAGSQFTLARRIEGNTFHVDIACEGSRLRFPPGISVDRTISASASIWHFSMVRTEEALRRKFASWSHATHQDWDKEYRRWVFSKSHPLRAIFRSQLERHESKRALKAARIPDSVARLLDLAMDV